MAIAVFLNDDGVQTEHIDRRPVQVRHGTSGTGTMTLSPLTRWLFLCASRSSTVWHSSLQPSQEKVILSLALSALTLLSSLSHVTQPSYNKASYSASSSSSLLSSWLLLPPRTSNGCSSVEAPSSSLPMFMLSRQARGLPPNRAS